MVARASRGAAAWVRQLQRSAIRAHAGRDSDMVRRTRQLAAELAGAFPSHGGAILDVGEYLAAQLPMGVTRLVPSHGDFHPENVFVAARRTTVVDLDTVALREPAYDVGYAIGQLLLTSHLRFGRLAPGAIAAVPFWRFHRRAGHVTWRRVALHVARTLLQGLHYELCDLRAGRTSLLGYVPGLAKRWVTSDGPEILDACAEDA